MFFWEKHVLVRQIRSNRTEWLVVWMDGIHFPLHYGFVTKSPDPSPQNVFAFIMPNMFMTQSTRWQQIPNDQWIIQPLGGSVRELMVSQSVSVTSANSCPEHSIIIFLAKIIKLTSYGLSSSSLELVLRCTSSIIQELFKVILRVFDLKSHSIGA